MNYLLETILASLIVVVPALVTGAVAVLTQWLRLRRARLRAERLQLPPSSEPPPPKEPWYSLRPRKRRRRE